jgi:hypothetical protein
MKAILIKEINAEMPNSQALGAFNSAIINTGGDVSLYGRKGYAVYVDGKQVSRAVFGLGVKQYKSGLQEAYESTKIYKQLNSTKGKKIQIGRAKVRYS